MEEGRKGGRELWRPSSGRGQLSTRRGRKSGAQVTLGQDWLRAVLRAWEREAGGKEGGCRGRRQGGMEGRRGKGLSITRFCLNVMQEQ